MSLRIASFAASRQAVRCGGSRCGGWRFAPTPLRCSSQGRAVELAARCALRSNSHGELVNEARTARRPCACASRRLRDRPRRAPPVAKREWACQRLGANTISAKSRVGAHRFAGASGAPSSAEFSAARLRASLTDSPQLFERSVKRAASSAVGRKIEQRRAVANGDRSSETRKPVRPHTRLCRTKVEQRTEEHSPCTN